MNTNQFRISGGQKYGEGTISELSLFGSNVANSPNFGNIQAKLFNTIFNQKWGSIPKLLDFFCKESKIAKIPEMAVNGRRYVWGVNPRYGLDVSLATALVGTNIGIGRMPFTICIDFGFYRANDLIEFPSGVQAKMLNDGVPVGSHYEYQVIIEALDINACLLASDQLMGTRIYSRGNIQGDGSYIGGHNYWQTPVYYDQYMTTRREHIKLTRGAMTTATWLIDDEATKKAGRTVGTWVDSMLWQWMQRTAKDLVFQMVFGKRTVEANGNCIAFDHITKAPQYAGSGLYDQIAAGNEFSYVDSFDMDFIHGVIDVLSTRSMNTFGNTWILMGGKKAYKNFHDAITAWANGQSGVIVDGATFIGKSGEAYNYSEGYTTYSILGNTMKFVHTDLFDDPTYFPMGADGNTIKSGEIMIMDIGELKAENGGGNNLCKLKNTAGIGGAGESGIEITLNGMIGFGKSAGGMSSSSFDGVEKHMIQEFGYVLHTVESCGIIRPKTRIPIGF